MTRTTERRRVTFQVPAGTQTTHCARCPQRIVWVVLESGKRMPVNVPDGTALRRIDREQDAGERLFTVAAFDGESHFATCPHANEFRRT